MTDGGFSNYFRDECDWGTAMKFWLLETELFGDNDQRDILRKKRETSSLKSIILFNCEAWWWQHHVVALFHWKKE